MRKKRGRKQDEAEVNMTPMLDIVFIMLIFFIVTATFIRESGLDVTRPSEPPPEKEIKSARPILIQINKTNDIYVDRRSIDIRSVRANVERKRAEEPNAAVIIQAERGARTGVLVQVMDQAREANAPVSIAPLEDGAAGL